MKKVYLTVKETAELLSISTAMVEKLIQQKKIRVIFDGEQYLIYREQFNTHLEQVKKYKKLVEEIWTEPIPEDVDVKDED